MKKLFLPLLLCLSITSAGAQEIADPATVSAMSIDRRLAASPDTLTATVFHVPTGASAQGRPMVDGATRDLSDLDVRLITLSPGRSFDFANDSADHLLIVREGTINIALDPPNRKLAAGGVALIPAGHKRTISCASHPNASFYLLAFKSRVGVDPNRVATTFIRDWSDLVTKKTDKGESRAIFSQPTTWLKNINMHATTLNPGEISHPQHMHRAEEILLLRSGNVRMHIANGYIPAKGGDLVFLPSGVPHDLENGPDGRAEYFALQWAL
jgi:quercetin dioxygenase-like cupin family protein